MIGELLRWLTLTIVSLGAFGYIYYTYVNTRPCVHPLEYSLGTVDPRFGISHNDLEKELNNASNIWSNAIGRTLFINTDAVGIPVNLIYDEREESVLLGQSISKQQEAITALRHSIDSERRRINDMEEALNSRISSINARGGATPDERARIISEQRSLKATIDTFNAKISSVNARSAALNTQVTEYNRASGRRFRAGEYIRDESGERINIYVFVGAKQLRDVLAHELGHAIGLDHNDDPNSIMFSETEYGNTALSDKDLSSLKQVCGVKEV